MSDEWKSYYNLDKYGYIHKTINHSQNFVDPFDDQIHTQTIENAWKHLKQTFPKNGTSDELKESYVHEYIYRQCNNVDFVEKFFRDVKSLYTWKI